MIKSLSDSLNAHRQQVSINDKIRKEKIIELNLEKLHDTIENGFARINSLLISDEKGKSKKLQHLVADIIKQGVADKIHFQEFIEKRKGEQYPYIYVGTHWMPLDVQRLHDYINKWARKIGLPENFISDPDFMKKVYERVAFMLKEKYQENLFTGCTHINLMNGTLVVDTDGTSTLKPHDAADFIQYVLPYAYDPEARCDKFLKFLSEVLPDEQTRMVVQEFFGYILSKNLKLEKMLVLLGSGSNGKSVLMEILSALLGSINVSNVQLSDFDKDQNRAMLHNKLANISYESGHKLNHAIIKTAISGEPLSAKIVYEKTFSMHNYGKLIVSFNKLPRPEDTFAFMRRLIIIPFNVTISEQNADKQLAKKIIADELPGILNWALAGLARLTQNMVFTDSKECDKVLDDYRKECNSVEMFMDMCLAPLTDTTTRGSEIYNRYKDFCYDEQVPRYKIEGKQKFYAAIGKRFAEKRYRETPHFYAKLTDYE